MKITDEHLKPVTDYQVWQAVKGQWVAAKDVKHKVARAAGRNCLRIMFRGELLTASQIADITGVHAETIKFRYRKGLREEALITAQPKGRPRKNPEA